MFIGRLILRLFRRDLGDTFDHLDRVKALFEGDTTLELAPAAKTVEACAEGFVLDTPLRFSQRLSSAFVTVEKHLLAVDFRIANIVDVIIFERDLAVKGLVTVVDMLFVKLGIKQFLEAEGCQLSIRQCAMEVAVLVADTELRGTGGKSHLA